MYQYRVTHLSTVMSHYVNHATNGWDERSSEALNKFTQKYDGGGWRLEHVGKDNLLYFERWVEDPEY